MKGEENITAFKCANCESTEDLYFVKTFSSSSYLNPEYAMHEYENHGWKGKWEPLREWTRLELLKLVHKDIQAKKHEGEEFYCGDCYHKLKWSVVE